jgi:hypothetical protein
MRPLFDGEVVSWEFVKESFWKPLFEAQEISENFFAVGCTNSVFDTTLELPG